MLFMTICFSICIICATVLLLFKWREPFTIKIVHDHIMPKAEEPELEEMPEQEKNQLVEQLGDLSTLFTGGDKP